MKRFMKSSIVLMLIASLFLGTFALANAAEVQNTEELAPTAIVPTINKTNDGLDADDRTNVTLSVPGEAEVLGSDIIYIVGSYASNADGSPNVEGDVLISSLVDTMREMVAQGTHVNFGMVPFSSDNVVAMPLTRIDENNIEQLPAMIADALATCEAIYDGVNMENALVKSKKMFSESELADHPERQHLVMISSGFTYFFNSGENNENVATVPVNYTGVNRLFFWNKAWQRARTNQTNTYPIPKAIVDAFNAKTDKAEGETLWSFYWSYIDQWAKADIADGDKVVFDACTVESGSFLSWYNAGELVSGYSQTGYGKAIPADQVENIADYVTLTAGANPLTNEAAAHAIGYERAMWEAYEYAKANIMDAGINFYPIYNALNVNYTNGNASPSSYNVTWTDQYIGHSFVDMLAGGEGKAVKYDKQGDKTFFNPIKDQILYYCAEGSYVEDFIGYEAGKGNFQFINNPEYIKLTVGDVEYITQQISVTMDEEIGIIAASYAFTAPGAEEPTFWMDYTYGDGKTTEKFVWTFGENVSRYNPATLTYKLQLIDKNEAEGDYVIDTNLSATLYPKDSDGNELQPEEFPVPNVEYKVAFVNITVNKTWDDNNDQDGIRPESITIRLLANGVEVDSMVVTEEMGWSYTFENLNKYANGEQIVYTITEDQVEGYTTVIDGFNVTNIHAAEQTQVSVQKVWDDDDDFEGKRPESITIRLFANNVEMEAVTVTEEMGWSYTFENLPLNVNGEKIVYTVAEDTVENYEMIELSGDAENGFRIVNQYQIVVEDPEPPRTGDPIALVMAMAAISMMGLAVIVLQRKKFN